MFPNNKRNRSFASEWDQQDGVIIAWPHAGTDWAYMLDDVTACYVDIVRAILEDDEQLVIVAPDTDEVHNALGNDVDWNRIHVVELPTNDTWVRDYGPITVWRDGGMVLTDYQSQDELHRGNFLARNRIIAALADCTVIVESADTGGSLVTASLAASYSRDVFAVPGRVGDQYSMGCNKLIKNNRAAALTSADDLIGEMRWEPKKRVVTEPTQREIFPQLTADEQRLIDLLRERGELHVNDISTALSLPIYRTLAILVSLDTRGLLHTLPGSRYSL